MGKPVYYLGGHKGKVERFASPEVLAHLITGQCCRCPAPVMVVRASFSQCQSLADAHARPLYLLCPECFKAALEAEQEDPQPVEFVNPEVRSAMRRHFALACPLATALAGPLETPCGYSRPGVVSRTMKVENR